MLTGKGKSRWKLSFHHRSPSSSSSSSTTTASSISSAASKIIEPPPAEFLCPISNSLMADPVILPTGHSLDRPCLEACRDLSFSPPSIDLSSNDFFFIPNVALKSAILGWCDRSALPRPLPLSSASARDIVRALMAADSSSSSSSAEDSSKSKPSSSSSSSSITSDETLTPKSPNFKTVAPDVDAANPLEEEILEKLKDPQISVRESALVDLRQFARESSEKRSSLCTQRLLSALIPFLLSRTPELQINAAASLVNLSIDPDNKVRIVRSGAVPSLVEALRSGHPEARDHAAGAAFSLAIEEDNRLAIGVLGAIPPLVHLFYQDSAAFRARKEAGMALYHLTLAANNTAKLAKTPGAARAIVRVASEEGGGEEAAGLRRIAMMVMGNMAGGGGEGRVGLMDAGAVVAVVGMLRGGAGREEEQCIGVLYGLSRGSLRFRALARAAEAEGVLNAVLNAASATAAEKGEIAKEMVRRILRVVRGEEDGGAAAAAAVVFGDEEEDGGGSVVSDGLVSVRRRYHDFGSGKGYSTGF